MKRKKRTALFAASSVGLAALFSFVRPRRRRIHSPLHLSWAHHRSVLRAVLGDMNTGNTMTLSAGIAYFAALAFFPTFAASLAITSIVIAPEQVALVVNNINAYLPHDIAGLITVQLEAQAGKHSGNFIIATMALAVSIFGASATVENTIRALNVAYGVKERRNLVRLRLVSVGILLCGLIIAGIVLALLIIDEYMIAWGVPAGLVFAVGLMRWPILLIMMSWAFAALYQYGPNRPKSRWRWASWGATIATGLWLIITALLYLYTRYFPTFSDSYTLFAGIVVLMMWFNFSALAILIGAHINARLETKASH